MAVTQNPHIGRSKNAFATAVFTTWKGRNVMKGKPISVHNPDTPAQKKQRSAFGATVQLWTRELSGHKRGFNSYASRMTEVNAFVQNNINSSVSANPAGDIITDFNKLVLAEGPLAQAVDLDATISSGTITINWNGDNKDYLPNQSASDQLSAAVIVQEATGAFTVSNYIDVAEREDGNYVVPGTFTIPAGGNVYVVAYFWSNVHRIASDSTVFEL